jgi:hypothetical protein
MSNVKNAKMKSSKKYLKKDSNGYFIYGNPRIASTCNKHHYLLDQNNAKDWYEYNILYRDEHNYRLDSVVIFVNWIDTKHERGYKIDDLATSEKNKKLAEYINKRIQELKQELMRPFFNNYRKSIANFAKRRYSSEYKYVK